MKKYRVTDKHEYLCNGVELVKVNLSKTHYHFETVKDLDLYFKAHKITEWLSAGWIEEIQEPKFTRDDMISFAKYYDSHVVGHEKSFNNWILDKEYKKE